MDIRDFQAKWRDAQLKERSASQEHFIDLCRVFGMPTPAEADKTVSFYTFEKGAGKSAGGKGFADVWWRGRFGWEYKGTKADLAAAYQQLLQYREDLENPPLLVVCDLQRFRGAYQLHRHGQARACLHRRRARPARDAGHPAGGVQRSRAAATRAHRRSRYRGSRGALRRAGRRPAPARG